MEVNTVWTMCVDRWKISELRSKEVKEAAEGCCDHLSPSTIISPSPPAVPQTICTNCTKPSVPFVADNRYHLHLTICTSCTTDNLYQRHQTICTSCTTDNLYQLYQTICTSCSRQPVPPSPNHLYQLYNRQSVQIVPNHLYQPHTKLSILLNISQTSLLSPNNVTIVIVAVAYI